MGRPKGALDKRPIEERFWAKVKKTPTCWLWTGARNNHHYGKFWDGKRVGLAHRYSWSLAGKPDPQQFLLHNCDTPLCVRPSHLRPGNYSDNMRDILLRGRGHGRSKLNPQKVRALRAMLRPGVNNLAAVAKKFGITESAVGHIKYGRTWTWLH